VAFWHFSTTDLFVSFNALNIFPFLEFSLLLPSLSRYYAVYSSFSVTFKYSFFFSSSLHCEYIMNIYREGASRVGQVVECVPSKYEALSLNPSTSKTDIYREEIKAK
jgi:hypothetical protein